MALKDLFKGKNSSSNDKLVSYKPVGSIVGTSVRENALVNINTNKWDSSIGEPHPFDPLLAERLAMEYDLCGGMVNRYANHIWSEGFYVTCDEPNGEKALKIINDFNRDTKLSVKGREWVRDALIKPGGYLEIERKDDKIVGLKVLDGSYIYVKRDEYGRITGYTQYFGKSSIRFGDKKGIPLKPENIVALHYNKYGDRPYGLGIVYPNMNVLNDIRGLERDMYQIMHRKANAPMHVKIGTVGSDGTVVTMPTPEDIAAVRSEIETLTNRTEWVTDPTWSITSVQFGDIGEKFKVPLDHSLKRYILGTNMAEVMMGFGNIPEGLAQEQSDEWDKTIATFQELTEQVLEDLYRRILLQNGFDMHIEVVWGQPSDKQRTEKINQILSVMAVVQPAFRYELEKQLAELSGVDPGVLEEPSEEREKEDDASQPSVPGDKNESFVIKEELLDPFRDDATVKEWLGFDYKDYLLFVLAATKNDTFAALLAASEIDRKAGLLTEEQVDSLREVLVDGFENGRSIKDIAKKIESVVRPGDLRSVNPDGSLGGVISKERFRVYNIARTETTRLANLGSRDFYKDSGVGEYRWVSAVGRRTCPECQGLNGRVFGVGEGVLPPRHPMCRCSITAVVE